MSQDRCLSNSWSKVSLSPASTIRLKNASKAGKEEMACSIRGWSGQTQLSVCRLGLRR